MKQKISIFGAYFNGNFGDDLMAHLVAKDLLQNDLYPLLWKGPAYEIESIHWDTAREMNEFTERADCVIIGGGMFLSNSGYGELWNDLESLVFHCELKEIPIIAVSIGSNETTEKLHPAAEKLINSPALKAISFRLASDATKFRHRTSNITTSQFSDIVLTSSEYRARAKPKKVLVCLPAGKIENKLIQLALFILRLYGYSTNSISQFTDSSPESFHYVRIKGNHYANTGIDSMLSAVRDCDILVGRGLHVGMAALAGGAIFISHRGSGKTERFLKSLDLDKFMIKSKTKFEKITAPLKLVKLILSSSHAGSPIFKTRTKDAQMHYGFIHDFLKRLKRLS